MRTADRLSIHTSKIHIHPQLKHTHTKYSEQDREREIEISVNPFCCLFPINKKLYVCIFALLLLFLFSPPLEAVQEFKGNLFHNYDFQDDSPLSATPSLVESILLVCGSRMILLHNSLLYVAVISFSYSSSISTSTTSTTTIN